MQLHIIHTAINSTADVTVTFAVTLPSSVSQTTTPLGAWSAQQDAPVFRAVRLPFHKLSWIKLLPFHKLNWIKLLPFHKLNWIKLLPFHKLNGIKLLPFHKLNGIKLLPFHKLNWIKLLPFHKLNGIRLKGLKAFNYSLDPGWTPIFELVVWGLGTVLNILHTLLFLRGTISAGEVGEGKPAATGLCYRPASYFLHSLSPHA